MTKSKNNSRLLYWLAVAALGLLIIIGQRTFKDILYRVIGIGLIVVSGWGIFNWIKSGDKSTESLMRLVGMAVLLIVGIWITANPHGFDTLINVVIGLVVIAAGVKWLITGWKEGRSIPIMVISVIAIIVGLIIATGNAATTWIMVMCGFGLIYTAVMGIIGEKLLG